MINPEEAVRKAVAECIEEQSTLRVTEQAQIISQELRGACGEVAEDLLNAGLGARVSMEVGSMDEIKRNDAEIRARAYAIWEREGYTGTAEDHWFAAQRELAAEQK
jgi:Protein of unknown function (DUF2934)